MNQVKNQYKLQIIFTKEQKKWLKTEAKKKGIAMGILIKMLIEKEMKK